MNTDLTQIKRAKEIGSDRIAGQTHLKYKNPLIAGVWAFYNLAYFLIEILIQ